MKEYALYKGEEILSIGTIYQISMDLGIKIKTFQYYGTNAYKRKLAKRKVKNARELVVLDSK